MLEDGFDIEQSEHGGAIAELGDTVLSSRARPEPQVSQEMGVGSLDGQDVVDRRAHLGKRRQAGSWRAQ